jgi:4a-hydroxytetrahydrobiopterin dehydratase
MAVLDDAEIQAKLALAPEWRLHGSEIVRQFVFSDFVAAMNFVDQVADAAENASHHPDIDIRWNKVRLALSSHDAGGITEKDFSLAATFDSLSSK